MHSTFSFRRLARVFVWSLFLVGTLTLAVRAAPAPDLRFNTANGPLALESLRGRVVYLDYWASWCVPCRHSFPWLNDMQARFGDQGFVVLAVNLDTDRAEAQKFLAALPARFTVAFDPEGDSARIMRLKGMPSSFLIDRQGNVVSSHIGFRESDRQPREGEIRALLANEIN
jgi:thiol-disulfide isomerase/thioredoxin